MFRFSILMAMAGLSFCSLQPTRADGVQDNIPENVRRIPEAGIQVPDDRAASLRTKLAILQDRIAQIKSGNDAKAKSLLPDVMIFERAVRCALDYNEFFDIKELDKADELLKTGIIRASRLMTGDSDWINQNGLLVRGYISRIDHTVQPYGLVIPSTYAINHSVPTRCDIWFHGRGEKLSEVNFLYDRLHNSGEFTPDHTIMLHPYGRYSNAFKFAGEVDVLEALEDVQKKYRIDEDRISVRGFSMGGAACWQFATHYSDRWFAANPGAGFSETPQFLKVFQQEELNPTPWEKQLWNLYDCDKWALNLTHCPTIAYSGEIDKQKQAADVMETAMGEHGIRLRHVIGKGMGHKYDPISKAIVEERMAILAKYAGRNSLFPPDISFQTHTLKYNRMDWLTIDGLEDHWKPALIECSLSHLVTPDPQAKDGRKTAHEVEDRIMVSTQHVTAFTINLPPMEPRGARESRITAIIDEDELELPQPFSDRSLKCSFYKHASGKWRLVDSDYKPSEKRHNLQGPIDDAFMDSFVFVRPTGTAANEAVGKWSDAELTRAIEHWRRHFRGDARVVNDVDVTDELIQSANLVLWGDPKSNSVMAKIADKLPIQWTADKITVGEKSYESSHHAPILIYPNPLNLNRYIVFNSSFTFREYAYLNNARQVPMLPDWAVIDLKTPPGSVWPGKVVAADFFNEQWQLK